MVATILIGLIQTVILPQAPSSAYARPGRLQPIEKNSDGQPALTQFPALSADGRFVAFSAPECLANREPLCKSWEVFVKDRRSGLTSMISTPSGTLPGTGLSSAFPSISATGRYVAFTSDHANLVPGDTDGSVDVFVRDLRTNVIERVTTDRLDAQFGQRNQLHALISASGRYVVFSSMVVGARDENGTQDVFLYDRRNQRTRLISGTADGNTGDGASVCPSVSSNGRYVAFSSKASNLIDGHRNGSNAPPIGYWDVYMRDMRTKRTTLVSKPTDMEAPLKATRLSASTCAGFGGFGPSPSGDPIGDSESTLGLPAINFSGRYIIYHSNYASLVPNDTNGAYDVFIYDRSRQRTERVSTHPAGQEASASSAMATIDPGGRLTAFSSAADLTADPVNRAPVGPEEMAVFSFDRFDGSPERISPERAGPSCFSYWPAVGGERYVTFMTCALDSVGVGDELIGYIKDRGRPLGSGVRSPFEFPDGSRLCKIQLAHSCLAPSMSLSHNDPVDDTSLDLGRGDATETNLVYRPHYQDLFAAIELERMPQVLPSLSPIFYGLRFEVGDNSYEVRATSLLGGTFGLFDCRGSVACMKVADLRGGYGTTGERVVFSLPLHEIGLEDGGELSDVEAFSALGSYFTGPTKILDTVKIQ